jgi:hypothetical protein
MGNVCAGQYFVHGSYTITLAAASHHPDQTALQSCGPKPWLPCDPVVIVTTVFQ